MNHASDFGYSIAGQTGGDPDTAPKQGRCVSRDTVEFGKLPALDETRIATREDRDALQSLVDEIGYDRVAEMLNDMAPEMED